MSRAALLVLLLALAGCGGGGDAGSTDADRVQALLDRQRAIVAMRPNVPADLVAEWDRNWPEILRLEPTPDCGTPDHPTFSHCILEWQQLTSPWVW